MSVLVEADKWIDVPVRRNMLWQSTMMNALEDDGGLQSKYCALILRLACWLNPG